LFVCLFVFCSCFVEPVKAEPVKAEPVKANLVTVEQLNRHELINTTPGEVHFKTRAAQGTHDLGADVRRQA
jgi:hypothetical protein